MTNHDTRADAASFHSGSATPASYKVGNRRLRARERVSPDVWDLFWNYRRLISIVVILATAVGVSMALLMTPVYRSSVLLMPTEAGSQVGMLGGLLGDVGGMSALAELGLGGGSRRTTVESLALLQSRQFIEDFIQGRDLMPILFHKQWDPKLGRWKSSVKHPPSVWRGYQLFVNNVLDVYHDQKTDLVTLNIDWTNRDTAAQWANELVSVLNDRVRDRAIAEADQTIGYLQAQIKAADTVELRQALNAILENQVKIRAIAAVRKQYAFRVLDPAAPADPDNRLRPKRTLYIVVAPVIGLALGLVMATLVDARRRRHQGEYRDRL